MSTCDLPDIYALALRPLAHILVRTYQANYLCPSCNYYIQNATDIALKLSVQ